jgi:hypothetical protein
MTAAMLVLEPIFEADLSSHRTIAVPALPAKPSSDYIAIEM